MFDPLTWSLPSTYDLQGPVLAAAHRFSISPNSSLVILILYHAVKISLFLLGIYLSNFLIILIIVLWEGDDISSSRSKVPNGILVNFIVLKPLGQLCDSFFMLCVVDKDTQGLCQLS